MNEKGIIAGAKEKQMEKKSGVSAVLNNILDQDGMRRRFDEILGDRAPQFISSVIAVCNSQEEWKLVIRDDPMSIITAALRAAMYDLPIDPALGYAYLIPRNNSVKVNGSRVKKWQAGMQLGYKGLKQLCIRTGAYSVIPRAQDVRQGELVSRDRLTGRIEFNWIDDDEEREKLPIIGYAAYFKLSNGAEAMAYMSKAQVDAHEKKYRPGDYMSKGWRDDWDAMAKKTVLSMLVKHDGLMSIDYRMGGEKKNAVDTLASAVSEDEDMIQGDYEVVTDDETGEIVSE